VSVVDAAPVLGALLIVIAIARNGFAPAWRAGLSRRPIDHNSQLRVGREALALLREQSRDRVDPTYLTAAELGGYAAAAKRETEGFGKRALDVAAAVSLLLICAPLMALTAVAIKFDSPGPILYRQRRIGLGGRAFEILKFRSMVSDAEKNGAQWAAKNDDRVTRVGRFIRKTRIDEIPQAINVLRGEMSFVGPRPERPEFVSLLEKEIPNYHLRHAVRPGITGWAQVKYVYGASVEDARIKLEYDLHYIKHFNLWLDVSIMFMTVRVALFGIGSR